MPTITLHSLEEFLPRNINRYVSLSPAFTMGFALGTLWAGIALDRWGIIALASGAAVLSLCSLAVLARQRLNSTAFDAPAPDA